MILGKDYINYDEAVSELKLESLDKRKETMALNFVKKSLENKNNKTWEKSEKCNVNQSRIKTPSYLQELFWEEKKF